jgi:hypothetical protein
MNMPDHLTISKKELGKLNEIFKKDQLSAYMFWLFMDYSARENGVIFSVKRIAKTMGITLATVYTKIQYLESKKILTVLRTDMCNIYFLNKFDDEMNEWVETNYDIKQLNVKLIYD